MANLWACSNKMNSWGSLGQYLVSSFHKQKYEGPGLSAQLSVLATCTAGPQGMGANQLVKAVPTFS